MLEQEFWAKLITQPDFADNYARYRRYVNRSHPIAKWFEKGALRYFGERLTFRFRPFE
jgi:hypothetical protein